jgi:hypothetical protein
MHNTYQNLVALIHAFGARPATTESESRLREYLRRRLHERGLTVFEQPFRSVSSLTPAWLTVAALFVASAVLGWLNAPALWWLGAGCSLAAMAMFWGLVSGRWDVMRLFPQRESANLIAVAPAQGEVRRRVVLMAHIDTQRAALMWHPRHVRAFGRNFQLQAGVLAAHTLGAAPACAVAAAGAGVAARRRPRRDDARRAGRALRDGAAAAPRVVPAVGAGRERQRVGNRRAADDSGTARRRAAAAHGGVGRVHGLRGGRQTQRRVRV